jgi:hypothetical protein
MSLPSLPTLQVLPDMSPWVDMGSAEVEDTPARMYQYKNMAGEKVNTYTFYISKVNSFCQAPFEAM